MACVVAWIWIEIGIVHGIRRDRVRIRVTTTMPVQVFGVNEKPPNCRPIWNRSHNHKWFKRISVCIRTRNCWCFRTDIAAKKCQTTMIWKPLVRRPSKRLQNAMERLTKREVYMKPFTQRQAPATIGPILNWMYRLHLRLNCADRQIVRICFYCLRRKSNRPAGKRWMGLWHYLKRHGCVDTIMWKKSLQAKNLHRHTLKVSYSVSFV